MAKPNHHAPRAAWPSIPSLPLWSLAVPLLAVLTLAWSWGRPLGLALGILLTAALFAAVVAAIHHAEVVAHRVGEPYGTLVLAVAVTIIEVALIVALMLAGGKGANALARDTVFARNLSARSRRNHRHEAENVKFVLLFFEGLGRKSQ